MRAPSDDTVTRTSTTTPDRAPCPTCGGSGLHPSTDEPAPCHPCQGTGIVQSAADAHATAHMHALTTERLLWLATRDLDVPGTSTVGALRYAAEHLTVQAAMMVGYTPYPAEADASPAHHLLSESMARADGEFTALHAALIGADGNMTINAMAGAAMIARSIAERMDAVESDYAALHAVEARAAASTPEPE